MASEPRTTGPRAKSPREADPGICARCAANGPTCCQLEPGHERFCFPVSAVERDKILDCAEGMRGAFAQESNAKAFVDNMLSLFPDEAEAVHRLFPSTKFHLRLATDEQGRCTLLGPEGCVLPREARPYYCRLFPLWVVGRRINLFTAGRCLAQRQGTGLTGLLARLGTTEAKVRELHGRLRLAWGLPPRQDMPPVETRPKKTAR